VTTIVYKDGVLASDSQMTEDSRKYNCTKLYRVDDAIVGLAGSQAGLVFLRWFRGGMDRKKKPLFNKDDDFAAIVVDKDGVVVYDRYCEPEPVVEPYHAIGSGAPAAFAALDMGATAEEAVAAAAKRDIYTGGPIQVMRLEEKAK
jgi:20S proteasome alpha/beta subunit